MRTHVLVTEREDREESEREVSCSFCGDFAMALSLAAAGAAAAAVVKAAVRQKVQITQEGKCPLYLRRQVYCIWA